MTQKTGNVIQDISASPTYGHLIKLQPMKEQLLGSSPKSKDVTAISHRPLSTCVQKMGNTMTYKEYLAALRSPNAAAVLKNKASREAKRVRKGRKFAPVGKIFTPEEIRAYCEAHNIPMPT